MQIEQWALQHVMGSPPQVDHVGWFAARQPGLVRFLETRLGTGTDACGVAMDASWRVFAAFEAQDGVPPARLSAASLTAAERDVYAENSASADRGWAGRQPDLCEWITKVLSSPPVPLSGRELRSVGLVLATVVAALDHETHGHKRI